MQNYKQDAPFTVQVDLTTGCNVRVPRKDGKVGLCYACGLNGIRSAPGDYHFMTVATAEAIAISMAQAKWTSQILFAGFGEPSLNPNLISIISVFKKYLPKVYMVMLSNGGGFVKAGLIEDVFAAGLSTLALEDYDSGLIEKVKMPVDREMLRYPENKDANPHQRSTKQRFVLISNIESEQKGTHAVLNNHAGSGLPAREVHARCAKPFREASVKSDGTVSICCIDWRRETEFGNVSVTPLHELWQSELFNAARRILITGDRHQISLCSKCDHPSYRVGLLPDKFGKVKLEEYTEEDVALLSSHVVAHPVVIVKRDWE